MDKEITKRYQEIISKIPKHVNLVAVSKTKPIEDLLAVYHLGQKIFGENYVQELIEKAKKFESLGIQDVQFHFIGHLQTNKVKALLPWVSCIESLDSFRLLEEINKQAKALGRIVPCFFQINIDEERSKSGFTVDELEELAKKISYCSSVTPLGFMIIPNPALNSVQAFKRLKELSKKYSLVMGKELSMGMSHDFEAAIQEGSTYVRVGSRIFGER